MDKKNTYLNEREKLLTPLLAIEEASRCLLCHDAPCSKACPSATDPAKFIRSLRFRNIKGAAETIRENNVLGGICARVCPTSKYCEDACSRCGIDKPIEIRKLQRYLTAYEKATGMTVLEPVEAVKEKIAIIGSGPSGLSAAASLVRDGYKVTVFEQKNKLGGWLSYGIPTERLPQSVIDDEIRYIKDLGVEFKTNCKIGQNINIDDLKQQGFKAILIAVGMQNSKMINIKGMELNGVLKGTEYLSEAKSTDGDIDIGEHVIVIGGGDVAIDCAVTTKLLGCEDVKIVYRRTIDKMPADIEEIKHLQSLNIPIYTGFKPEEIIGKDGSVNRFKAVGMFDDASLELVADRIIFAIGQEADPIKNIADVDVNDKQIISICDYQTNIEGVFAAGDIVEGDKTVVYAVKHGKDAAIEIANYLNEMANVKGDR
ncbi:NAD(P)-dependent oxidoreductase [Marinisporobacter balticus]|uniref:dihydrouracil dehydrogenase (NAD(+)) n=1 Tax=Marinisporobacter balticus TaxID=2018667 RepID=A0A4R2KX38_9FIRM|nr:NAD(P)-dependent oxidoreductase [Marinisporobacter balticus]TCO74798.1 dihydropyrimidine dehydrogenase (NAD+) subunit PreT [Marinisporobacter balticus]